MSEQNIVEVYRAENGPHAHLLRSALENAGIAAVVDGDVAQAGAGVPAGWAAAPRILVHSDDAPRAQEILSALDISAEKSPETPDDEWKCPSCGAEMREEDETCRACGWSPQSNEPTN